MAYTTVMLLLGLVLGMGAVASNPSPYFAALGLVAVAGMGCGVLVGYGGPFLSLVLFLIYLGGMLVVFAYSAALAAEPYPETWGSWPVLGMMAVYCGAGFLGGSLFWEKWYEGTWSLVEGGEFFMARGDMSGVAMMYSMGGGVLVVAGGVLLLALFVVLELTRGTSRGTLRAV